MCQPSDSHYGLSLRLSEVLSDIGVNEEIVNQRREMYALIDIISGLSVLTSGEAMMRFLYGSQIEGSTTLGLRSDIDFVSTNYNIIAIQDLQEWKAGKIQHLMEQNDRTSPGYCLIQALRLDKPLPVQFLPDESRNLYDSIDGKVYLRHSLFRPLCNDGGVRHGPAVTEYYGSESDGPSTDIVGAITCSSWPKEALPWLKQQHVSGWPTTEMKRRVEKQGCFVVAVASKTSVYQDLEWRISTVYAEKELMLSLNITQMRCYILMKMIRKTYIDPICKDIISSFVCKTVLFWYIAESPAKFWSEPFLIERLIQCLEALLMCVLTGHCPHFIIPGNNLLAGKLTEAVKDLLARKICSLIRNIEQSVRGISIDDLGERLHVKSGGLPRRVLYSNNRMNFTITSRLALSSAAAVHEYHSSLLSNVNKINVAATCEHLTQQISVLQKVSSWKGPSPKAMYHLLSPFPYTQLGSIMASEDIRVSRGISHRALELLTKIAAPNSLLKLASALYCSGDIEKSIDKLAAVKRTVEQTHIFSFCICVQIPVDSGIQAVERNLEEFERMFYKKTDCGGAFQLCVRYLRYEQYCVPKELRYEMFRSTQDDLPYREEEDFWMDWAVVDFLPFLYFLQYKVYSQVQRPADKQTALDNLIQTIDTDPNLGHRETAFNLLGQCMEQENRWHDALRCYKFSLNVRPRNNVVKWHIGRMLLHCFQNR